MTTTADQIHSFLTNYIGVMLEELTVQSGLEIVYTNRNLDRIAHDIEDYMGISELPDVRVCDEFKVEMWSKYHNE